MMQLIYTLLLVCGLVAPIVFTACGIYFALCAFMHSNNVYGFLRMRHSYAQQMATEIARQASQLDTHRLRMFLKWLRRHSVSIQLDKQLEIEVDAPLGKQRNLESSIQRWLELFPVRGQLWEYRLLLNEVTWWRDLEEMSLRKFMSRERYE